MNSARIVHTVEPHPGAAPEVGTWLWAMDEVRRGLVTSVAGLEQDAIDWRGPASEDNSVGSLLYHLALIEMSWLYEDVLLEDPPADIEVLFPASHRTEDGRLAQVPGTPLAEHLDRLERSRSRFVERVAGISAADWHTLREPPGADYACTPAWVAFHLVEHEAGHLFQIRETLRRWRSQG